MLGELKTLPAKVVREESEPTPMAREVHASYTRCRVPVGPWDRVTQGAYHQLVAL